MARRSRVVSRILWAVDAFEEEGLIRAASVDALRVLSRRTGAVLEAVYVLSPAELRLTSEFTPPWIERYQPAAEQALRAMITRLGVPGLTESTVLVQAAPSRRAAVDLLARHAQKTEADAIVVGTHARGGLARLLLGSFAETLILHAKVPCLVVGPGSTLGQGIDTILFPTDLGEHSRSLFEYTVRLAAQLGARISIYHALPNPFEPVVQHGVFMLGGGWVQLQGIAEGDRDEREKRLRAWASWASHRGVPTEYQLDERNTGIAAAILDRARETRAKLIAMAARSGPVAAALLGSVSRQVVRHAPCPVWILHPPLERVGGREAA